MSNPTYSAYSAYPAYPPYHLNQFGQPASVETTEEWGRKAWAVFHENTFGYRAGLDEQRCYQFYYSEFLGYIKCATCLAHYQEIINRTPIRLYSEDDLFAWTVDVHNQVNRKLGKPIVSVCEAKQIWYPRSKPCCSYTQRIIYRM